MGEMEKDRILISGATGHLGRRLVKASLALGHPTFILYRPEIVSNIDKVQILTEFKMQGVTLFQGSFQDHESLVPALKQVDVVISATAGSHGILEQLKLIEAIKEVPTIKRFLPSEYGMDVDRMEHAIPPGNQPFIDKQIVRRAIEKANIPYTYVTSFCYASIFLGGLAQLERFMPPIDHVVIYGDGNRKCVWIDEDDIATYAIMTINDPRTLNKKLYLRPPGNILTQMEVVEIWEKLIGKKLKKTFLAEEEWLRTMHGWEPLQQVAIAHLYQIFYCGDLDFEIEGPQGVDSNHIYSDYKHVTAAEFLKRYV